MEEEEGGGGGGVGYRLADSHSGHLAYISQPALHIFSLPFKGSLLYSVDSTAKTPDSPLQTFEDGGESMEM